MKISNGIIGGLAGGMIFGMMMQMMGAMPTIAKMIGSDSLLVGWMLHLIISAITGALFAVVFGSLVKSYGSGVRFGLIYGMIWWVLGALVLMPVILGMGVQFAHAFEGMALASLMGHAIWGMILGSVYHRLG